MKNLVCNCFIKILTQSVGLDVTKTIVPKFGPGPLKLPNRAVPVSIPHEESDDWLLTPYTEIIPTKGVQQPTKFDCALFKALI